MQTIANNLNQQNGVYAMVHKPRVLRIYDKLVNPMKLFFLKIDEALNKLDL